MSPPQSVPVRHCSHALVAGLHRGAAGGQFRSATHATHTPRLALPASVSHWGGVVPPQSALLVHARQAKSVASQIGFGPEHSLSERHPTHVLVGTSHTGVAPVHAVWLVAEQTAQKPEAPHAGVAGLPVQAGSLSQAHGTPSVLNSSS